MRSWAAILIVVLAGSLVLATATASTRRATSTPNVLPKPPAGRATVGGRWLQLGKTVAREEVELEKKLAGKEPKTVAKVKTDARGSFVFKAVLPGTYRLSVGIVVETAKVQGKRCSLPGFGPSLSIGGTDNAGRQITIIAAQGLFFTAKAGDRITKDIVYSCK